MKDWEQPDPSHSLFVAMKNWNSTFFKSRAEEVKFGQHQLITLEFIDVYIHFLNVGGLQSLDISYSRYNCDRDHFLQDYSEANVSFSEPFGPNNKQMVNASFTTKGLVNPLSHYLSCYIYNLLSSLYIKLLVD